MRTKNQGPQWQDIAGEEALGLSRGRVTHIQIHNL